MCQPLCQERTCARSTRWLSGAVLWRHSIMPRLLRACSGQLLSRAGAAYLHHQLVRSRSSSNHQTPIAAAAHGQPHGFSSGPCATAAATAAAAAATTGSQARSQLQPPSAAYVHLPFCKRKCFYCDFPVEAVGANPGKDRKWGRGKE